MNARKPAVSGTFYPATPQEITSQLDSLLPDPRKGKASACISPHAGWTYSGKPMARAVAALRDAPTYVFLCPNHTGKGKAYAVSRAAWHTPLGKTETDTELAAGLVEKAGLAWDETAHAREHSIEVILPAVQYLHPKAGVVAVCLGEQDPEKLADLGNALFTLSKKHDFGVIASSDFTHYQAAQEAKRADDAAISHIMALDPKGFLADVQAGQKSICGALGITALLAFAKQKGLSPHLLQYTNSGEATGEPGPVVAYAALSFY